MVRQVSGEGLVVPEDGPQGRRGGCNAKTQTEERTMAQTLPMKPGFLEAPTGMEPIKG